MGCAFLISTSGWRWHNAIYIDAKGVISRHALASGFLAIPGKPDASAWRLMKRKAKVNGIGRWHWALALGAHTLFADPRIGFVEEPAGILFALNERHSAALPKWVSNRMFCSIQCFTVASETT